MAKLNNGPRHVAVFYLYQNNEGKCNFVFDQHVEIVISRANQNEFSPGFRHHLQQITVRVDIKETQSRNLQFLFKKQRVNFQ